MIDLGRLHGRIRLMAVVCIVGGRLKRWLRFFRVLRIVGIGRLYVWMCKFGCSGPASHDGLLIRRVIV